MLAQNTPDLMIATNSLAHEPVNACVRVALAYQDFCRAVVRDNREAANGKKLIDAYVNPDGREGDGTAKVKTYPTEILPCDVRQIVESLRTLSRLAHRVRADVDMMATVERAARVQMARLANLDRDLWNAWTTSEKAHMGGADAAILDIDGFAWTASRKGHTTEIRYSETAQGHDKAHKSAHYYMHAAGSVSERDIASL
jgi:hypothetical protein